VNMAMFMDYALGFRCKGDVEDFGREIGTNEVPSPRPLGGGSLHPASNLVYDHRFVYKGAAIGAGSCVYLI
jgi:hypothetical protein